MKRNSTTHSSASAGYLLYLATFSGLYVATLKYRQRVSPGQLPPYPDPSKREQLFLVLGEVHNAREPGPSHAPHWLTIPERGLFTGTIILGAVGSGKTATAIRNRRVTWKTRSREGGEFRQGIGASRKPIGRMRGELLPAVTPRKRSFAALQITARRTRQTRATTRA